MPTAPLPGWNTKASPTCLGLPNVSDPHPLPACLLKSESLCSFFCKAAFHSDSILDALTSRCPEPRQQQFKCFFSHYSLCQCSYHPSRRALNVLPKRHSKFQLCLGETYQWLHKSLSRAKWWTDKDLTFLSLLGGGFNTSLLQRLNWNGAKCLFMVRSKPKNLMEKRNLLSILRQCVLDLIAI